ncbi:MAG: hypothetical protein A3C53_07540 [Omnitrophica WOR_2 bacterium RIFCSPHIGHO2_02_FULL_68_15]|nr:MAG: hypothetical protein A3C53_07540 [Omnitrophica WOR_2 bacterium RIFCSPHIGHO2_02_FULL_68_15]
MFAAVLFTLHPAPFAAGAQLPSLFRGVVVADSAAGVRVISVEESSQAHLADLRPEDVIVRVQETELRTIEDFAALSSALKGRAASATVLVFRNGAPRELTLHLYSYPVLRAWGLAFVPQYDVRFAEPPTGLAHWVRLGDGFTRADKPAEAIDAYLNGLHNVPNDAPTALKVSELLVRMSRERLSSGDLAEGTAQLNRALKVMNGLFTHPLSTEGLESVKRQLTESLAALRDARPLDKRAR